MNLTDEQVELLARIARAYKEGHRSQFLFLRTHDGSSILFEDSHAIDVDADKMDFVRLQSEGLIDFDTSARDAIGKITGRGLAAFRDLGPGRTPNQQAERGDPDPKLVFVVHGRDEGARASIFSFLRAIGLQPMEWSQAVRATGEASPYVGTVLDTAFSKAQAIVVLFTPDEEARLREGLCSPGEADGGISHQARPNVLFEAGMAMGRRPDRTVLVEVGKLRPFSDIGGRHVVRLSGSPESRKELAQRLETAKCQVDLSGDDWLSVGVFDGNAPAVKVHWERSSQPKYPPAFTQAVAALDNADPKVRKHAIETLAQTDDPLAHDALVEAARHPIRDVRMYAGFELASRKDPEAVPGLLEALRDRRPGVSQGRETDAENAITGIGQAARKHLLSHLSSQDKDLRKAAALGLGKIADGRDIDALAGASKDDDPLVRWATTTALAEYHAPKAVAALIATLSDDDPRVRRNAAQGIGKIADPAAVGALCNLLTDGDEEVRRIVAIALGAIGDGGAVPLLLSALDRETAGSVVGAAAYALGQIGSVEAVPALIRALEKPKKETEHQSIVRALGQLKDEIAIPALFRALREDPDKAARGAAALALAEIGNESVFPELLAALSDSDFGKRTSVIIALGKLKDPRAIPALVELLPHQDYCERAAEALREVGTPEALRMVEKHQ